MLKAWMAPAHQCGQRTQDAPSSDHPDRTPAPSLSPGSLLLLLPCIKSPLCLLSLLASIFLDKGANEPMKNAV